MSAERPDPTEDALIAAIRANPNDDAPRLVWADREGGERGELVVLQCALQDRGLDEETRARYIGRENELLRKRGSAWSGGFGQLAHPTFRRGFLDHLYVEELDVLDRRLDRLDVCAPLLTGLQVRKIVDDDGKQDWPQAAARLERVLARFDGRLRNLRLPAYVRGAYYGGVFLEEILGAGGFGRNLERLDLMASCVTPDGMFRMAPFQRLEHVTFGHHSLNGAALVELLDHLPNLKTVALMYGLSSFRTDDVERLLASPRVTQLTELSFHQTGMTEPDRHHLRDVLGARVTF